MHRISEASKSVVLTFALGLYAAPIGAQDVSQWLNVPKNQLSASQMQLTQYLVSCALPEDQTVWGQVDDRDIGFEGNLGLAPNWAVRPLTTSEQRWLSACLLARTNYFGVKVEISMRAEGLAALHTTVSERADFPIFEAGFFGNLFSDNPRGYVCRPETREQISDPVLDKRVCAEPVVLASVPGEVVTRCGFILVGTCSNPSVPLPDETVFVYLAPSTTGHGDRVLETTTRLNEDLDQPSQQSRDWQSTDRHMR